MAIIGKHRKLLTGIGLSLALFTGGAAIAQMPMPLAPQGQPDIPFSGAPAEANNQAVVDMLNGPLHLRPYHTLTPAEARQQPTFTDGVMAVMRARGMPTTPPPGTGARDAQQWAGSRLHDALWGGPLTAPAPSAAPVPAVRVGKGERG